VAGVVPEPVLLVVLHGVVRGSVLARESRGRKV